MILACYRRVTKAWPLLLADRKRAKASGSERIPPKFTSFGPQSVPRARLSKGARDGGLFADRVDTCLSKNVRALSSPWIAASSAAPTPIGNSPAIGRDKFAMNQDPEASPSSPVYSPRSPDYSPTSPSENKHDQLPNDNGENSDGSGLDYCNELYLSKFPSDWACQICMDLTDDMVELCVNRHQACRQCADTLHPNNNKTCGICRQPLLAKAGGKFPTHRFINESIAKFVLPCKHAGCDARLQFSAINDHMRECEWREVACPYAGIGHLGCDWKGCAKDLKEHMDTRSFYHNEISNRKQTERMADMLNSTVKETKRMRTQVEGFREILLSDELMNSLAAEISSRVGERVSTAISASGSAVAAAGVAGAVGSATVAGGSSTQNAEPQTGLEPHVRGASDRNLRRLRSDNEKLKDKVKDQEQQIAELRAALAERQGTVAPQASQAQLDMLDDPYGFNPGDL